MYCILTPFQIWLAKRERCLQPNIDLPLILNMAVISLYQICDISKKNKIIDLKLCTFYSTGDICEKCQIKS